MTMRIRLAFLLLFAWAARADAAPGWIEFPVPEGSGPHDVAPAPDGMVWFSAQAAGALGRLDPPTGHVDEFPLGHGPAPHGVIVGPDGAPWVIDGGLNAVLRVDPASLAIRSFPLPADRAEANLNTATFDKAGMLSCPFSIGLHKNPRRDFLSPVGIADAGRHGGGRALSDG
jgi:virginiamycin B lyase